MSLQLQKPFETYSIEQSFLKKKMIVIYHVDILLVHFFPSLDENLEIEMIEFIEKISHIYQYPNLADNVGMETSMCFTQQ